MSVKQLWVIDDEYVSSPGLIGIHRGLLSNGYIINKDDEVTHLSIVELQEKVNNYTQSLAKTAYSTSLETSKTKFVIEDVPAFVAKRLQQIYHDLRSHKYKNNPDNLMEVTDWLNKSFDESDFYATWFEIATVIHKSQLIDWYLNQKEMADQTDISLDEINSANKVRYTRDVIDLIFKGERHESWLYGISSITFRVADEFSLVLAFNLESCGPYEAPTVSWIDFFLSDSDVLDYVENEKDWLCNTVTLTDDEILELWD